MPLRHLAVMIGLHDHIIVFQNWKIGRYSNSNGFFSVRKYEILLNHYHIRWTIDACCNLINYRKKVKKRPSINNVVKNGG